MSGLERMDWAQLIQVQANRLHGVLAYSYFCEHTENADPLNVNGIYLN